MRPWQIWTCDFTGVAGAHPAVVIGAEDRVHCKPLVNVLLCSTRRAARKAELHEVILDQADGLDWKTICKCDLVYVMEKSRLTNLRGTVSGERRRAIAQRLIAGLGLAGL